jgi:hypothetical protein
MTAACLQDLFSSVMEMDRFLKQVVPVSLKEIGWFLEEVVLQLKFLMPTET